MQLDFNFWNELFRSRSLNFPTLFVCFQLRLKTVQLNIFQIQFRIFPTECVFFNSFSIFPTSIGEFRIAYFPTFRSFQLFNVSNYTYAHYAQLLLRIESFGTYLNSYIQMRGCLRLIIIEKRFFLFKMDISIIQSIISPLKCQLGFCQEVAYPLPRQCTI